MLDYITILNVYWYTYIDDNSAVNSSKLYSSLL